MKTLIPRAPCWLFTFQSSRLRAFAARKSVSRAGFNIVYVEKLLCAINWEQRESCEYFLRVPLIAISQKFQLEFFHSPVSILHSFPIPGNFFPNFSLIHVHIYYNDNLPCEWRPRFYLSKITRYGDENKNRSKKKKNSLESVQRSEKRSSLW